MDTITIAHSVEHHSHELPSVTFREGEEMSARLVNILGTDYAIVIAPDGTERALPYSAIYLH